MRGSFYICLLLCGLHTLSGAQSFSVSTPVVVNTNAAFSGYVETKATIKNNTNHTLFLEWVRSSESLPSNWEAQVCTDQCSTPSTPKRGFTLLPKQEREIKVVFYPRRSSGNGTVELSISNIYDYSEQPVQLSFQGSAYGMMLNSPIPAPSATKRAISVFPNPVTTSFQMEDNDVVKTVEVHNSVGRKVAEFYVNSSNEKFNIAHLPAGIYFVRMISLSGEIVHTARITKISP